MGRIRRLGQGIIEKIAAGEVIERPSSVVKECIENAIDAGATRITIELRDGGKQEIVVSDNGSGMAREDASLAVERHTTSKLSGLDELFAIKQLGFRGEALASIAAVSVFKLITSNNPGGGLGTLVEVDSNGKRVKEIAAPCGTKVIVRRLFYNTPARKKFLDSGVAELKRSLDIVTRYALAYPEIGFVVRHEGTEILNAPASPKLLNKVSHIYGADIARNMIEVRHKGAIGVEGLICVPSIARKTRSYESIFVNKRFVQCKLLRDALESAFKTLLFLGGKPVAVINVSIAPSKVDVNVHPTKLDVKFSNPDTVFTELHLAIKNALEANELIAKQPLQQRVLRKAIEKAYSFKQQGVERAVQSMLLKEKPSQKAPGFRVLGQVANTYIIAEVAEGFIIVDQHAAAERINLEKLASGLKLPNNGQKLLQPIIVTPPKPHVPIIRENLKALRELGFDVEGFGDREFLVREVPVVFKQQITKEFLNGLFDEIANNIKRAKRELVNDEIIYSMACKASIKANDELSIAEMESLLTELFKCRLPYACAHGRPTIIRFTTNDLEHMFKRKL